jgi:PAS domain S-box-containing protein
VSPAPLLPPLLLDAPIAVASFDLEGRIIDANPALLRGGGYTIDEVRGRPFAEFLDPEAAADALGRFAALVSGAVEVYRTERCYRARNGRMREVDLTISLVRDDNGHPAGGLAVLQDVTPYKTALREAARRAAELEAVVESMPAAVYISDQQGIKTVNQLGLTQLGFRRVEEMAGAQDRLAEQLQLRDPQTGEPIAPEGRTFARALRGERVDTEVRLTHLETGADRLLRSIAAPIVLDGAIVGAVAMTQDITDQRAIEDALRLSEARYRELVDQSPLSIQILSPDGETRHVNKAWERLWGVTLADVASYNLRQDAQLIESGLMPTIENAFNGVPGLLPAILYDPDRTLPQVSSHQDPRRWVRAVIYPVRGPAGTVREVVLIHEDITEQMRADQQRQASESERERLLREAQASQRDLEAASRMKDEFLAVLSHELRTPLNAVLGWARILRSCAVGEQTVHAAAVIERNALAQARLIDDLIDLARIITGKTRLALDEVDVGAVASGVVESVRPAAGAKRIALALDIPEPLPIVSADPQRLQQVFWNLLSNAVKFTEAGGSVSLSVFARGQEVTAQVTDTGIGIPAAILPVVFDRFTQGDSSSTRAHSGLGLGLAIVRHLVELHGGTVQAFSDGPGTGSTFRFSIPRREEP